MFKTLFVSALLLLAAMSQEVNAAVEQEKKNLLLRGARDLQQVGNNGADVRCISIRSPDGTVRTVTNCPPTTSTTGGGGSSSDSNDRN